MPHGCLTEDGAKLRKISDSSYVSSLTSSAITLASALLVAEVPLMRWMSLSLLLIWKRRKLRALPILLKRFTLEGMRGIGSEAGLDKGEMRETSSADIPKAEEDGVDRMSE